MKLKIKLSKSQWEGIGKKAQIVPIDGFADGGEAYTDDEMQLIDKKEKTSNEVKRIKDEIAKIIDEFGNNLLDKEGFESRMKELIRKMYIVKGKPIS